jgi:isopentenyl-diphosphate delta-isomerase
MNEESAFTSISKQREIMGFSDKSKITVERKNQHLQIVIDDDVVHGGSNLLEDVHLLHNALPELNLEQIDLETEFFGKKLSAPLMITSMTGGAEFAEKMNRGLAEAAEMHGIAFAVGSQRVMLRYPEYTAHFAVRKSIPNGVLLGNIGAVQLGEYPLDTIVGLVEQIEADGICVHLNPAQELMQAEGHRDFAGLTDKIAQLNDKLQGRVLVKETGAGISAETMKRLASIGVKYVDVSGSGGTSWTKVESYRAQSKLLRNAGKTFADWGIPTAYSILTARRIFDMKTCIIGSGGIVTGLDSARAIALGANIAGFARAILLAFVDNGVQGASDFIESNIYELKSAMLLTGSRNIEELQKAQRIYTGKLRDWLSNTISNRGDRTEK